MGQRFFAINMFAPGNGGHRSNRMNVIGRGDYDGVDVFLFIEHFAKVFVALRVGIFSESSGGMRPIDITERDNILRCHLGKIPRTLTGNADTGDVEFSAWRRGAVESENMTG